ncbi:hypothetical protein E1A91_D05G410100v1 [Gossypium mustelinum]|uniref:Uncharacterized protein n=1 Tax=Gossypium mustelinum TaxID=34275 RepID=A0A5D2V6Q6_GOSMU|nr:hypothetical protein E1A91_D05G410100v1 [Gossypium mustelinum]
MASTPLPTTLLSPSTLLLLPSSFLIFSPNSKFYSYKNHNTNHKPHHTKRKSKNKSSTTIASLSSPSKMKLTVSLNHLIIDLTTAQSQPARQRS